MSALVRSPGAPLEPRLEKLVNKGGSVTGDIVGIRRWVGEDAVVMAVGLMPKDAGTLRFSYNIAR